MLIVIAEILGELFRSGRATFSKAAVRRRETLMNKFQRMKIWTI